MPDNVAKILPMAGIGVGVGAAVGFALDNKIVGVSAGILWALVASLLWIEEVEQEQEETKKESKKKRR